MMPGGKLVLETAAVVLAGGQGSRLGPLTRRVCKPALPFGASYRNIDFSLSNCVNSGVRRIGVATQYKPEVLIRHIGSVWNDVARRRGEFLDVWPAEERAPLSGYRGTADAVFRNLDRLDRRGISMLLVLAGDHIYQMDYRPMLAFHRQRQADATIGCVEIPAEEASQFGVMSTDRLGRVLSFVEKPPTLDGISTGDRVLGSMGIYVFDIAFLARVLGEDAARAASRHDFGADIIPALVERKGVFAFPFRGRTGSGDAYWRDVGSVAAYWRAHLELLGDQPRLRLDDPAWPMKSIGKGVTHGAGASIGGTGNCRRSLIAADCEVAGAVHRSVLFAGTSIGAGSIVDESIVLPGAVIGRNCRLAGAIVDSHCTVPDGTIIDLSVRRARQGVLSEPIVLTADDFVAGARHAIA